MHLDSRISKSTLSYKLTQAWFAILFMAIVSSPSIASMTYEIGESRSFSSESFHLPMQESTTGFEPIILADSTIQSEARIMALSEQVAAQGRFLDRLQENYQVQYPIGIVKQIGGLTYAIVLEGDEITPEGAFVQASMCFVTPDNKRLAFEAKKIPLSATGGLNGVVEMALIGDKEIDIQQDKSRLVIKGGTTKVRFDCNGFIEMIVDAEIEFANSALVLEDTKTGAVKPGAVSAEFTTAIQSWSDLMVTVSLPPFQISGLKGVGFEIQNATFDFSDLSNAPGIEFPKGYDQIGLYGEFPELWKGFFVSDVVMRMPKELNDEARIEVRAKNMIIDDLGVSGAFSANNLISLEKGAIAGWNCSVEKVEVQLVASTLTRASIDGRLRLPIMSDTSSMVYAAMLDQAGNFLFTSSMPDNLEVPALCADVTIDNSSTITIEKRNGDEVVATVSLNGEISVNAPLGNAGDQKSTGGFNVSGLKFQNLALSTSYPNFQPGVWSLNEVSAGSDKLNGFSLTLSGIEAKESQDGKFGLGFNALVSLSGDKYCASSTMTLWVDKRGKNWKFDHLELEDLYLKADGPVAIEGYFAVFRDDPEYGDGFAGRVSAKFVSINVRATAVFGEIDDYKYWYVDALAVMENSPIAIGPVGIYGFGGGAYYHMSQKTQSTNLFSGMDSDVKKKSPINYIPDKETGLGLKASVVLGVAGNPRAFHAMATFEVAFNNKGGLRKVAFYGDGYFMTEMNITNPTGNAPLWASTYLGYDVENRTFHGNFKVYVNVANGMIRGVNPGNLAGEVVMHFEPGDWYIHVGRPSRRVGVEIDLILAKVKTGSYFMVGTKLEEMPPPPDNVLRLLGRSIPENRNTGQLIDAKGIAFGTDFSISTGDKNFLIFYARFDMGVGFDVMLADRSNFVCAYNNRTPGINGWYAEGQVYAYIEGKIGIKVRVFRKKIKADIIDLGVATLLEAKLPNPVWMRGAVGGRYRILGGLVKGKCNFEFEIGNKCDMVQIESEASPVEALDVISMITPENDMRSVDVFSAPQIVFNYSINKEFSISDDLSNSTKYKVLLDEFNVYAPGKRKLNGSYEWNADGDVVIFNPYDILPQESELTIKAKVHFQERINDVWRNIKGEDGRLIVEEQTCRFQTGEAPPFISESNIEYRYPLQNMMNFYINEYDQGYVALGRGRPDLFSLEEGWKKYGRFTPAQGGSPVYVDVKYISSTKKVEHIIPNGLQKNMVYKFELVKIPSSVVASIDHNVYSETKTRTSTDGNEISVTARKAEGALTIEQESILYTCFFRTSHYTSFAEKIQNIEIPFSNMIPLSNSKIHLQGYSRINEQYDAYEISDEYGTPLIQISADQEGSWLKHQMRPLIYDNYPVSEFGVIVHRPIDELGLIPIKAVRIVQPDHLPRLLNDNDRAAGGTSLPGDVKVYYEYNLASPTHTDYLKIKARLLNGKETNDEIKKILNSTYPGLPFDVTYPLNLEYVLPGGVHKSSTSLNVIVKQ